MKDEEVLMEFPKFELSYEKIIHNKVYNSDVVLAIPEGKPMFAWFKTVANENMCYLLEITGNGLQVVLLSFSDYLCIDDGTILYGRYFKISNQGTKISNTKCFSIEDIYYYKGERIMGKSFYNKLKILKNILNYEIQQNILTNNTVLFGLPLIKTNVNNLLQEINLLPYKVDNIKFRTLTNNSISTMKYINSNKYNNNNKNNLEKGIFKVVPDIQNDIYNLYVYNNGNEEYYDIAYIPDYKTSVMMNKLFRNIKENSNLDLLEESDSEEEFENESAEKYVYLDRTYKMNCLFSYKFKKWYPVSLASKNDRLTSYRTLIEK
jgi:hypothetical protein